MHKKRKKFAKKGGGRFKKQNIKAEIFAGADGFPYKVGRRQELRGER